MVPLQFLAAIERQHDSSFDRRTWAPKDVTIMRCSVDYKIDRSSARNRDEWLESCAAPRNNTLCVISVMLSKALEIDICEER